jgi:hypothetical protein
MSRYSHVPMLMVSTFQAFTSSKVGKGKMSTFLNVKLVLSMQCKTKHGWLATIFLSG